MIDHEPFRFVDANGFVYYHNRRERIVEFSENKNKNTSACYF